MAMSGGSNGDFDDDTEKDDGRGNQGDGGQSNAAGTRHTAAACQAGRGGGAGDQTTEDTSERCALAAADEFTCEVGGQADADDEHDHEHDHEPDGKGIEHAEVTHLAIWQSRQDDEPCEHETCDLTQIVFANAAHHVVQRFFTLQQYHDRAGDDHGDKPQTMHGDHARGEHHQHGHFRGEAGIRLLILHFSQMADDDDTDAGDQRCGDDPTAVENPQQAAERTQE